MKIVVRQDIGSLGANESEPVIYHWPWYRSVFDYLLWLLLPFVIAIPAANRNRSALSILIPLFAVSAILLLIGRIFAGPSAAAFSELIPIPMVLAVLMLLAHKIQNKNRLITFLLALLISTFVLIIGSGAFDSLQFLIMAFVGCPILSLLVLTPLVLAGWFCRVRYTPARLMLFLAAAVLILNTAVSLIYFIIVACAIGGFGVSWLWMIFVLLIFILVFSAFLYVILSSYLILAFRSAFYRQRFYACFRLPGMETEQLTPEPEVEPEQAPFEEQAVIVETKQEQQEEYEEYEGDDDEEDIDTKPFYKH